MPREAPSGSAAARLLADISATDRPIIDQPVAIVVAHPDDETLGCGGLLPRLANVTIIHVTDGAPRSGGDAARQGLATPEDYAALRRRELEAAVELAGIGADRLVCLDVPDQEAASDLAETTRRLVPLLQGLSVVLTHAFEGGHPDHDATAFAVAAAVRLLGKGAPEVVEMPFYRADPEGAGWIRQRFAERGPAPRVLQLSEVERAAKLAMLAAHRSQGETLAGFGAADEAYRLAPIHDFAQPANGGAVLYDRYAWRTTSTQFCGLARDALGKLGLSP